MALLGGGTRRVQVGNGAYTQFVTWDSMPDDEIGAGVYFGSVPLREGDVTIQLMINEDEGLGDAKDLAVSSSSCQGGYNNYNTWVGSLSSLLANQSRRRGWPCLTRCASVAKERMTSRICASSLAPTVTAPLGRARVSRWGWRARSPMRRASRAIRPRAEMPTTRACAALLVTIATVPPRPGTPRSMSCQFPPCPTVSHRPVLRARAKAISLDYVRTLVAMATVRGPCAHARRLDRSCSLRRRPRAMVSLHSASMAGMASPISVTSHIEDIAPQEHAVTKTRKYRPQQSTPCEVPSQERHARMIRSRLS